MFSADSYEWKYLYKYPKTNEISGFVFKIKFEANHSITVDYPHNIPDCHGLPDCGFIPQDTIVQMAKDYGFIKDGDKYRMFIEQNTSVWIIEKVLVEGWEWDLLSIDIRTGEIKHLGISHRID